MQLQTELFHFYILCTEDFLFYACQVLALLHNPAVLYQIVNEEL